MLKKFDENCKKRGLSITVQRQQVYQMLMGTTAHPTVDTVYEVVRRTIPTISRATVYRTLETLADEGLIRRVLHPGSSARYDGNPDPHNHLVCVICGKTEDYEAPLSQTPSCPHTTPSGFDLLDYEIVYRGICPDCKRGVGDNN